jgi:MFS family permease
VLTILTKLLIQTTFSINNIAEVLESFDDQRQRGSKSLEEQVSTAMFIMATCNAFGHFSGGAGNTLPLRQGWLVLIPTLSVSLGMLAVLAADSLYGFYFATALVAFAYGISWVMFPLLVAQHFAESNFSQVWGLMSTAPAFGTVVFNSIFGFIYDRESDSMSHCVGPHCYGEAYTISAICCALSVMLVFPLIPRTILGGRTTIVH